MNGYMITGLKKRKRKSGKPLNLMKFPHEDNKVEIKYETQSEILFKKIKETILLIIKPVLVVVAFVLILYGVFYIGLFLIALSVVLYFYRRLKHILTR